jgi:hypothetical protein
MRFQGTNGAVSLTNLDGGFHDFEARLHLRTLSERIAQAGDPWGGAVIQHWIDHL